MLPHLKIFKYSKVQKLKNKENQFIYLSKSLNLYISKLHIMQQILYTTK